MARARTSDLARTALGPLRPAAERAHRRLSAGAWPHYAAARLRRSGDPRAEALAAATMAITGRGLERPELAWAERIERARLGLCEAGLARAATERALPGPWGRFLFTLARGLAPSSCVELGTGVGISTAYLAAGLELNGSGGLLSIERSAERSAAARGLLAGLSLERAQVREGRFEQLLDGVLAEAGPVDLAFIDSMKTEAHVRWCVEKLAERMAPGGVLLLDDIHWSRRMAATWRRLRRESPWILSADLWRLGLLAR